MARRIDKSIISGRSVEVRNGNFEQALRRWKKVCLEDNVVREYRERQEFTSKSEKKRRAKDAGKHRTQRKLRDNDPRMKMRRLY